MKSKNLLIAGALALSTVMTPVASMLSAMPINAEERAVSNDTGHVYKAYQVFAGSQTTDPDDATIGSITWGNGVDSTALEAELKGEKAFENIKSAQDVADILKGESDNSALSRKFAEIASKHVTTASAEVSAKETSTVNLDPGYYLFVDQYKDENKQDTDEVVGLSLLQVTKNGNITITAKNDHPSVVKKVSDEIDEDKASLEDGNVSWKDTADHEIGETFEFKLTATLPNNDRLDEYETYKLVFNDTVTSNIEIGDIVSVTVNGTHISEVPKQDGVYTTGDGYKVETTDTTLTITVEDLVKLVGDAGLKGAVVEVTYKATLKGELDADNTKFNEENKVYLEYSNNPNYNGSGDLGKTSEDHVFVGTLKLPGTKIDGATAPTEENLGEPTKLAGAEFVLKQGNKVATFTNKKLTGWKENVDLSDYKNIPSDCKITSDDQGDFSVTGLDAGNYKLVEIKAPDGYNILTEPIDVEISNTHPDTYTDEAKPTITVTVNGKTELVVENNKGGTLPETGGMGTTMLYTVGTLLVGGAGIAFVTNKRMKKEEK